MFIQCFYDYDLKSYPRGYYFNFLGIIRVLKFKTNTVMQKDDWIFIIEIFGREYILSLRSFFDDQWKSIATKA